MSTARPDLLPWRKTTTDPSAAATRAADLVDAARDVPALPPEALARIKANVLSGGRPDRAQPRFVRLGLRFAVFAMIALASVTTAKATMILWQRHVAASAPPPLLKSASVTKRRAPRAVIAEATTETPPVPAPVIEPSSEVPQTRGSATRPARARRVALASPIRSRPPEILAPMPTTEAQLVAGALSRLRQAHDPVGALGLLDQHARLFPHGVLESEAFGARLEAVIQMDDRKTALRLLDGRSGFAGRLGWQQLLTRAELRTNAGRHADGLADFDRLLATTNFVAPAEVERALYGRAVCRGRLGQDARARSDLLDYQRQFPDGKHAAEVARLLKSAAIEPRP